METSPLPRGRLVITDHFFGGVNHEREVANRFGRTLVVANCSAVNDTKVAVAGADVVLVNFAPFPAEVLSVLAPGAVLIRYGIGYDNIDVKSATALGIKVCNVPDYGGETVADHTVACLLGLLRRTGQYTNAIRGTGWVEPRALGEIRAFSATTVGLVGTGRIGLAVADRLRAFGFRVIAFDPFAAVETVAAHGVELVGLDELLDRSDAISLHAPLTSETKHLIGTETLAKMRHSAVLVNTARGGLVDEAAVAAALASGQLGGAALDVFDPEPLASDSPLRDFDNVILTPHAAFYSVESLDNLQRLAAEEAGRALAGEPLRCPVN